MTKEETSRHFNIPIEILDEYHEMGLCDEVKKVMGSWQYDDTDVQRLGLIMTLHDVGFTHEEVTQYMQLESMGKITEAQRKKMLDSKRKESFDEIHFKEKQLDRLDYLRHKMNNK